MQNINANIEEIIGANFPWKNSCAVATTGSNVTTSSLVGSTIDGYVVLSTDRVLVKDQTSATENGVYINNAQAVDFNTVNGYNIYYIENGTLNAGCFFYGKSGAAFSSIIGSVSSVALSLPGIFSVSGSPVTTTGTLTASLSSQSQNLVFASPDGSSGAPDFRALLASDLPTIPNSKLQNSSITVATGSAGSDFNVSGSPVSLGGTITLNLPDAGSSTRGAVSTGSQTIAGTKTFSSAPVFSTLSQNSVPFIGSSGTLSENNAALSWTDSVALLNVRGTAFLQDLAVSPSAYSTGTITSSGLTVTGSGTSFSTAMIGGLIVTASAASIITAFSSTTSITTASALSASASAYTIYYGGAQSSGASSSAKDLFLTGALYDASQAAGSPGNILSSTGTGIQWISAFPALQSFSSEALVTSTDSLPTYTTVASFSVAACSSGTYALSWYAEFGTIANSAFIQITGSSSGTLGESQNNQTSATSSPAFAVFEGFKILTSYTGSETITFKLSNALYYASDPASVQRMRFTVTRVG